ncbi:MAG: lysophospholipid acyltransferase family protein [Acidobacteria bacterium]|nr:lysophospholipid acyltransferase family protein [Acidobacteriota bacterium]
MASAQQSHSPVSEAFTASLAGWSPAPVREFLHNALQLAHLEKLYSEAVTAKGATGLADRVLTSLGVTVSITEADIARVPPTGPVVVVANHPFGLVDGLMLDSALHRIRPDVRMVANGVLSLLPEVNERVFPVDVFSREGSTRRNAASLRAALGWLERGGMIAVFPAGEVAHWDFPARRVLDPVWSTMPARLARITGAAVLPAYFEGSNSLAFQVAGLIHPMLRTASLPRELLNKRGHTLRLRFGSPVHLSTLAQYTSDERATQYLRARTYMLGHGSARNTQPPARHHFGFLRQTVPSAAGANPDQVRSEIASLGRTGSLLLETREFAVYVAAGSRTRALVHEIGRLREETFRAVGEGTGRALDLDRFDDTYEHVVLWDKLRGEVAGAYRMAETERVLPASGVDGLYTSTLFRYHSRFFQRLGPAVELGRSFIVGTRQKEFAPLLLLWKGIAQAVARRPNSPVLFGAVSISREYGTAAKEMIIQFLRQGTRRDLADYAKPRNPFRGRLTRCEEIRHIGELLQDIDQLNAPIRDVDRHSGVPVLLRQYLKLGGEVLAFNVDARFSSVVDCLLMVDLRKTDRQLLDKYMGATAAEEFLAHHRAAKG